MFGIKDVDEEKSEEIIEKVVEGIEKEKQHFEESQPETINKPFSFDKDDLIQFIGVTKKIW